MAPTLVQSRALRDQIQNNLWATPIETSGLSSDTSDRPSAELPTSGPRRHTEVNASTRASALRHRSGQSALPAHKPFHFSGGRGAERINPPKRPVWWYTRSALQINKATPALAVTWLGPIMAQQMGARVRPPSALATNGAHRVAKIVTRQLRRRPSHRTHTQC